MKATIPQITTSIERPVFRSALIFIGLVLACIALPERAHAVSPAPDGGYPGGNTAEGQAALLSLTTGGFNTAVGYFSLRSNTEGQFNTAVGAGALFVNMGDPTAREGIENTAIGAAALFSNTTGAGNTANGAFALFSNTTGGGNTAIGDDALIFNTTGYTNTATGDQALLNNTMGFDNTAFGSGALIDNTTGNDNIAIGYHAGSSLTTGHDNIDIGSSGAEAESGTIRIGGQGFQTATYIAGIFGATVVGATPVLIDSSGKLGTTTSSKRFKEGVKPMDQTSEALYALEPVTFRYKKEIDPAGTSQFGLLAEEVERVNPALVVRDKEGKPYTVRYDQVNAMLLNEFLKEHRKVQEQAGEIQEQKATISEFKKGMETVVARLQEQESKIQRVNAQLQMSQVARCTSGRIRRGEALPQAIVNNSGHPN